MTILDIYQVYASRESPLPSSGSECKLMNVIEFINAVFDTVLDMIIAAYYDNPLISMSARLEGISRPINR